MLLIFFLLCHCLLVLLHLLAKIFQESLFLSFLQQKLFGISEFPILVNVEWVHLVVLYWYAIFLDQFISKMNGVLQVLNFGFWVGQEAPIQDKQSYFRHRIGRKIKLVLLKDRIHTDNITLSQNLELTDFSFFILYFNFNLAVYYEIDFVAFLVHVNEFSFFFNSDLSHLVLNFVKEHGMVFQVVSFKVFNLFQQFDFEFLKAVRIIIRVLPQALAEHVACIEEHRFFDSGKSAIIRALNGGGSLAVEDERNFTEVVTLVQKLWNMCDRLLVVAKTDFTLTFSYEKEMKSFFVLFNYNIVGLLQIRNYILDQIVYEGLITAENLISFKGIYKDMLHHQVL